MEEVDLVITDSNIPDQMARRMEELGIEYVTVDVPQR
jgi:DeoR/GlpR family transcriptional regulator of sugar metabolism